MKGGRERNPKKRLQNAYMCAHDEQGKERKFREADRWKRREVIEEGTRGNEEGSSSTIGMKMRSKERRKKIRSGENGNRADF